MTARLHVLLGAGGVGKTTLAAGYALALSRTTKGHVGVLGIDPSRRLKDALGLALADDAVRVPGEDRLYAAVLSPNESIRRWAAEASVDRRALDRLAMNPFFVTLADRLATATDIFAAARVAEWAARDPHLTDLVVDTAPGINAIEFLTRPEHVAEFLNGRLVGWLRRLSIQGAATWRQPLAGAARRALASLARLGGAHMLVDLVDFFSLVEGWLATLSARVQATQRWLHEQATRILLVTSVRDDGGYAAAAIARALDSAGLVAHAVIVNRVLSSPLASYADALREAGTNDAQASAVIGYALRYVQGQQSVVASVKHLAPRTLIVPEVSGMDGEGRLDLLARVGEMVRVQLD